MFSLYSSFLSFNIFILPLYFLLLISYVLIHLNRRFSNLSINLRTKNSYQVISFKNLFFLVLPFILLICLLFLSIRADETLLVNNEFLNFFYLKKILMFIFIFFIVKIFFISCNLHFKSSSNYYSEILLFSLWFSIILLWSFCINSIVSLMIFIEIMNMFVISIIYYIFILNRKYSNLVNNYKFINFNNNIKFSIILSVLYFLWCSALSLILIIWSLSFIISNIFIFDLSFIELIIIFNMQWNYFFDFSSILVVLFILFFSFILKMSLLPVQFWLFIFYKNLPTLSLLFYFLFFYIYGILLFFNVFFGYLYLFSNFWFLFFIILVSFSLIFIFCNFKDVSNIKTLLTISSIINIILIFSYFLSIFF